jgi:phosphatidylserine decarboxylase
MIIPLAGWVLLGLTGFMAYFFRDPERVSPTAPGLLLSPADGTIVAVTRLLPEQGQATATLVSVFLSVFDVHINRAPVAGEVVDIQYQAGKFLPAFRADASDLNEQNVVTFQVEERAVVVKQIAGILARRIVCRVQAGDRLSRGERFGLIRFGSRVDTIIPPEYEVYACPGQRVRGGESVLAASLTRSSYPTRTVETQPDQTLA